MIVSVDETDARCAGAIRATHRNHKVVAIGARRLATAYLLLPFVPTIFFHVVVPFLATPNNHPRT